jgi:lipid A 3-O-deacylase
MAGFEAMFSTNTVGRLGYSLRGLLASLFVVAAGTGRAQHFIPESIGVRGGAAFSLSQSGEFYQTEAFADWNLPWKLESESGWFLQTKLTLSAGWLGGNGINAAEGTLAPALGVGKRHFPVWLEGGIGPTWISEYQFSSANFGEQLQFTSFLGVNVDITSHWRFGYRFQHMSNAGLAKSNPGLNLNMLALSYAF